MPLRRVTARRGDRSGRVLIPLRGPPAVDGGAVGAGRLSSPAVQGRAACIPWRLPAVLSPRQSREQPSGPVGCRPARAAALACGAAPLRAVTGGDFCNLGKVPSSPCTTGGILRGATFEVGLSVQCNQQEWYAAARPVLKRGLFPNLQNDLASQNGGFLAVASRLTEGRIQPESAARRRRKRGPSEVIKDRYACLRSDMRQHVAWLSASSVGGTLVPPPAGGRRFRACLRTSDSFVCLICIPLLQFAISAAKGPAAPGADKNQAADARKTRRLSPASLSEECSDRSLRKLLRWHAVDSIFGWWWYPSPQAYLWGKVDGVDRSKTDAVHYRNASKRRRVIAGTEF